MIECNSDIAEAGRLLYNSRLKFREIVQVNRRKGLHKVIWFTLFQTGITLLLAIISAVFYGWNVAFSAMIGGLIVIIPDMVFAWMLFRHSGARAARNIVSGFYKGEALKFLLVIILFTLVFVVWTVTPLAFFLAFLIVQLSHWFAPWLVAK